MPSVERSANKVQVRTAAETTDFDEVIFACHGNQVLALFAQPSAEESSVLQEFQTSRNDVVLHTDISFLLGKRAFSDSLLE